MEAVLSNSPETYIREHREAVPAALCREIIDTFKGDHDGRVIGNTGIRGHDASLKVSNDIYITERSKTNFSIWGEIDSKLAELVNKSFNMFGQSCRAIREALPPFADTGYLMHEYEKGKGFFKPHSDAANIYYCNQFASCVMYMNTVEEGGETHFPDWGVKIKPEQGKMLWYPSALTHRHEGCMPISDNKYIVTTFMIWAVPK